MSEKRKEPSRVVFLGDIPYDLTETQVGELAKQAGPVHDCRLVYDRERNRSRGYAFIEYDSIEAAQNAVQMFHGVPLKGRVLRADFSNDPGIKYRNAGPPVAAPVTTKKKTSKRFNDNNDTKSPEEIIKLFQDTLRTIKHGHNGYMREEDRVPVDLIANDNISRTLSHFRPDELVEVIANLKILMQQDPTQAPKLLQQNPQLIYALVQALLLMGLVDESVVAQAMQGQSFNPTPTPPPPPPPPSHPQSYSQQPQHQGNGVFNHPSFASMSPQEAEMIRQVLSLTNDQINALNPQDRAAIMALRQQYL
ncbi:mRNA 3'-end-processing protein Rna15p [Trichomonascus vanleenenianus]|uniref:mRNA 3'-end-processing protein Rna15p n=1 Tax=Trichomonascus vanleenenianus TaxID=2268995 RepID=UPI003ECAACEB